MPFVIDSSRFPGTTCQASIIHLGYSVEENWRLFNQTAANIMETHWMLLEGAPAKEAYPEVNATWHPKERSQKLTERNMNDKEIPTDFFRIWRPFRPSNEHHHEP